jgi:hypothetical protein
LDLISVFGKSIIRPPRPRARRLQPVPGLPWRSFALALLAVLGSVYALVRYYGGRGQLPSPPPAQEIPAPDLVPVEK